MSRRRAWRGSGCVATGALALGLLVAPAPGTASVAPQVALAAGTPSFVATLGGPGLASLYPSGLETMPDGSVVAADTGRNRISRYTTAGKLMWTVGTYGSGNGQFNNPRDVGIDSAGNVYVADTANTRIVKLTSAGAFITSWRGPAGDPIKSPIGISVKNDLVYVADGNSMKVRIFSTGGTQLRTFASNGACVFAALRDVDADSAGNIFIANYTRHDVLELSPAGACLRSWGTQGEAPGQFKAPYGISVRVDPVSRQERVYVADSNNERIQVFSTTGKFLASMGSAGTNSEPGTFTQLRRVAVDPDGNVWGADLWGWRLVRFDRTATGYAFGAQIGTTVPALTDDHVFGEPRGIAFEQDGTLRIADTLHHRIVRMTASGHVLSACGQRGSKPGEFNWPRGVAVDSRTGDLWVTDTKQYRLQVVSADCTAARFVGSKGSGPDGFNWPMSIAIRSTDRTAWVADTNNDRVVAWDVATQTPLAAFGVHGSGTGAFDQPRGIAVSPLNGHVFVADRTNNRIVELSDTGRGAGIKVVATHGGFNRPEGVAVGADGRIYVADTANDQLVVLDAAGAVLGRTSGPSGLQQPASVAVGPDGRIYVSDTYGNRIQVFAWGGSVDVTPAESAITSPAAGSRVRKPVALAGSATDSSGVSSVAYLVQDTGSKKYWNAARKTWGAKTWNSTRLATPGGASTTWSAAFSPSASRGSYQLWSRAKDTSANVEKTLPTVRFSVIP